MEDTMGVLEERGPELVAERFGTRITRARCRVCDEAIAEVKTAVPAQGDMVFGGMFGGNPYVPAHVRTRYYCLGCGIRYEFIREEAIQ